MRKFAIILVFVFSAAIMVIGCENKQPDAVTTDASAESTPETKNDKTIHKHDVTTKSGETASTKKNGFDSKPPVGTKAFCPVMHNEFTVSENTQMSEYQDKTYAFCCPGCKPQFDADPGKFL